MIVGYMRRRKKPGHMAKLLAIMCKYEGIELLYLTPEDVNINSNKIIGKMLINKVWRNVETDIPAFIDINPNFFNSSKYKEIIKYLKENTLLSSDKRLPLPKDQLKEAFKDDIDISKYLIPTKNIDTTKDIIKFVGEYNIVVLKPIRSNRGRNVYILKKEGSDYVLGLQKEEKVLTKSEFVDFFNKTIKNQGFIVQKCIMSRNKQGDPFDCRIHVEKNGKGKWSNPKNFIRIGVGQKVVSNVGNGGGISNLKKFLKSTYPDKSDEIQKELKNMARILPYKVEQFLGRDYMTFGFDVGIDTDGKLYLFEVNDFPIVSPMKSEIAMARAGYYRYMLINDKN